MRTRSVARRSSSACRHSIRSTARRPSGSTRRPSNLRTSRGRRRCSTSTCGAGTITLALSDHAKKVLGAEIVPEAIDDARENAARNGVKNAEFFCGDASDVAKKLARENLRPDVITVDPPRKGLAADVVESIAEMQPQRVVYVSCDSATMARDVKRLADLGYTARRACAVDMFPRADHVEAVCLLTKE